MVMSLPETLASAVKGVKLLFAHDTEVALQAAADLVNTGRQSIEALADVADLDAFVAKWEYTGTHRHTDAELEAVRALRPRLARR